MPDNELALYIFRKMVYLLYLEIGSLQPWIHPQLARKAKLKTAFFQREKERQAASLYHQTETETDPEKILEPYAERTGLTLNDVHRAFVEGDWRNKHGAYNFGGPRWAKVAELALELRKDIEAGDEQATEETIHEIKSLKTNQGYLINQFERTERRRQ
jgi:hypothetical protein